MSELPKIWTRDELLALVADPRYRRDPAYYDSISDILKKANPDKNEKAQGMVHVEAHERSCQGDTVWVHDYLRRRPGASGTVRPIDDPVLRNDSTGLGHYGADRKGKDGTRRKHKGIDLEAAAGTSVLSPVDGKIAVRLAYKGHVFNDEFKAVAVKGEDGKEYVLRYVAPVGRDGKLIVKNGDRVKAGDPIGTVQDRAAKEKDGRMKNHIHFEIWSKKGGSLDPAAVVRDWQSESKRTK